MFPIPGYAAIYPTPGDGVFQIYQDPKGRLGLEKIDDTFVFNFKLYDLGCEVIFRKIIKTWESETFVKGNKNLGVIFNGLKGTGKTIAAKVLSNKVGLPVIIVSKPFDGLLEFVQSLCFECVVLIDEAEKTFDGHKEDLLKMIDGVYNNRRKLYLLTTNRLTVDENLIGRPGRIRYIKEFNNLTASAVNAYIDDNLVNKSKKAQILEIVDSLIISTIDILKSIVDEFNIHGFVDDERMLNIPRANYRFETVYFGGINDNDIKTIKEFILSDIRENESVKQWLNRTTKITDANGKENKETNEEYLENKFDCWVSSENIPSFYEQILEGQHIKNSIVVEAPDRYGFFVMEDAWNNKRLYCITSIRGLPSLYRGGLVI
jgi:hypothetical protein